MKTLRLLALAVPFLAGPLALSAQPAAPLSAADRQGIDATLEGFGSTLAAMDFDAFARLLTADADWVNIVGMHWHGREQIVKGHRVVFTTRYHGQAQHITEKTEAALAPGVVLVIETIKMDDYTTPEGKPMTNNFFRMTLVLEKHDGKWLIRSGENTVIDLEAAKHDPGK